MSLFFGRSSGIPSITMAVQVLMSRRANLGVVPRILVTRPQPQQNGVNAMIIGVFQKNKI